MYPDHHRILRRHGRGLTVGNRPPLDLAEVLLLLDANDVQFLEICGSPFLAKEKRRPGPFYLQSSAIVGILECVMALHLGMASKRESLFIGAVFQRRDFSQ